MIDSRESERKFGKEKEKETERRKIEKPWTRGLRFGMVMEFVDLIDMLNIRESL